VKKNRKKAVAKTFNGRRGKKQKIISQKKKKKKTGEKKKKEVGFSVPGGSQGYAIEKGSGCEAL